MRILRSQRCATRGWLAAVVLAVTTSSSASANPLLSAAFLGYEAEPSAIDVTMGDVDGDGKLDMVVLDAGTWPNANGVSLLLGNGDHTFQARRSLGPVESARKVRLADCNHDAILDLIILHATTCRVSVRLGAGGAAFGDPSTYDAGVNAGAIEIADLDSDSNLDVIAAASGESMASTLLGSGDGRFDVLAPMPLHERSSKFSIADASGDGILDLIVGERSNVAVYPGNGDGTFGSAILSPCRFGARSLSVADFDRDGDVDVTINHSCTEGFGTISVLLGNGDGTFAADMVVAPVCAYVIMAFDANHDGVTDIVAGSSGGFVVVIKSNGDGTFQPANGSMIDEAPFAITHGDLDGDGIEDVAAATTMATITVAAGNADGTFGRALFADAGQSPSGIALGDFNGDGRVDAAVTLDRDPSISLLFGHGDGQLDRPSALPVGGRQSRPQAADLNADGHVDLAVLRGRMLMVFLGNGDGIFLPSQNYTPNPPAEEYALADMNGDRRSDFVFATRGSDPADGAIVMLLSTAADQYVLSPAIPVADAAPDCVALGDLNGDGRVDVVTGHAYPRPGVRVWLGRGDGQLDAGAEMPVTRGVTAAEIVDLDHDGNRDVAFVEAQSDSVWVLRGTGDGGLQRWISRFTNTGMLAIRAADFDGDGIVDLGMANTRSVSIVQGMPDGTLGSLVQYGSGGGSITGFDLADLNRDGRLDIVAVNNGFHPVSILLGSTGRVDVEDVALDAVSTDAGVLLQWTLKAHRIENLRDVAVERAEHASGPYEEITPEPLRPSTYMRFTDVSGAFQGERWYRLALGALDGRVDLSHPVRVAGTAPGLSLDEPVRTPARTIQFAYRVGPDAETVRLALYDSRGRIVRELWNGRRSAGRHAAVWDGSDARGRTAAHGVYFVALSSERSQVSRKVVVHAH